ncbi:ABC transporter substrate-binding protein [Mesorhizobium sp. 2RAF21]|uniref:ABC transporter substrate-binding protein n=1 Tax=Mesorhizobium sp. 2RAF21 TaxID=3232995 RepID=UPI003F9AB81E
MNRRILTILTASLVASLSASTVYAGDTIKIGGFGPRTGPVAGPGLALEKGVRYAFDQVNAAGGIKVDGVSKQIEYIAEDSQSKPDVGLSAAQKLLTRDNVDIIMGDLVHSDVTLAVMELTSGFPKVLYIAGATSLAIEKKIAADPNRYAHTWKHNYSSDAYAATVIGVIDALVAEGKITTTGKKIGVIAEDTGYSTPILEALEPSAEASGWHTIIEKTPLGQADFYPQLSKLKAESPEIILSIFTSANSAIALTKQLKEQDIKSIHIGVNGPTLPGYLEASGTAANGTIFTPMLFDLVNNPDQKKLIEDIRASLKENDIGDVALQGYCMGSVLADAIKRAGSIELAKLDEALSKTDYQCLSNRWQFKPDTHGPKIGPGLITVPAGQIIKGQNLLVWPSAGATSKFTFE